MASKGSPSNQQKNKRFKRDPEEESDSSSAESEKEDSESEENEDGMEIPVEFEAQCPRKEDFRGIRNLLQQLFFKNHVNLSELSDLITDQGQALGSVIKVVNDDESDGDGDDDDENRDEEDENIVYGISTVVDLSKYKESSCVQQVRTLVIDKCQACADEKTRNHFITALDDDNTSVGLLINERFINIPPQIALPLYKSLSSEIEKSRKKKKEKELDYLLLICKSFKAEPTKTKKKGKKGKSHSGAGKGEELNFSNAEDEILLKEAVTHFSYEAAAAEEDTLLGGNWGYDDAILRPYRTVMLIPYRRLQPIVTALEGVLAV